MKILVVGNGGREHALVWKIRQSPLVEEVYCAPGNAGIAEMADCVPIDTSNIVEVADFAQTIKADLTVVGPELPMVLGIGEEFVRRGLAIFCPSRAAAEIEGSKVFAREFMARHNIPSPRYEVCQTQEEAVAFVDRKPFGFPFVVKADGLASGKGSIVVDNAAEAKTVIGQMMSDKKFGSAGAKLVMEEFLSGEEVSFLVVSDGAKVVPMVSVQDHKRALDGDKGPNTGGMGTVSPATNMSLDVHKQIMQEIILPTIAGLASEGRKLSGGAVRGPDDDGRGAQGAGVQRPLRRPRDAGHHGPHALRHRPHPRPGGGGPPQGNQDRVGQGARGLRGGVRQGLPRHAGDGQGREGPGSAGRRERRRRLPRRHRQPRGPGHDRGRTRARA